MAVFGKPKMRQRICSLRGLVAGVHVGKNDMTPREVMEWYGGQLIDIVDNNFWFAMNSFVNCVDKFCPEV